MKRIKTAVVGCGSVLVFCVGLNLVWGKKIRVANLLPSLIVSVIWAFL